MAEFFDAKEKIVDIGEPVIFENKTDSSFDVGMGVVFHKSGIYEVSLVGNKTIVSKIGNQKIWPEANMITHIILETLRECGIYGEEATMITTSVLKKLGRDDLLLPCMR